MPYPGPLVQQPASLTTSPPVGGLAMDNSLQFLLHFLFNKSLIQKSALISDPMRGQGSPDVC